MVGWHHGLNGHEFGELWELVMDRESWHAAAHGVTKNRTQLSNRTGLNPPSVCLALIKTDIQLSLQRSHKREGNNHY